MVRGGITKANSLLLGSCRAAKRAKSGLSKFSGTAAAENSGGVKSGGKIEGSSDWWVPHPRTGIYFPKGHEWVMEDVPADAARLNQTYWFRNVDGVDK
ncbi:uncharacterized protein LOC109795389 isoform X1 [Cajanus cajan]|uniref:Late embryogenesis abundant protein Lea5 n=1 Tax=Cajanus cajan TaxID=3821 RepID=A0A151U7Q7_CAJCA|nr:uncharacterized protein LOC109795389 isoform X1 [Cajanus cajan]KYP75298.1 hypothetical protein KK1_008017 [Cajanus cajan]